MKLWTRFAVALLFACCGSLPSSAQQSFETPTRSVLAKPSTKFTGGSAEKFNDGAAVRRVLEGGNEVEFVPVQPQKGARIEQLGEGFVLGKWKFSKDVRFGGRPLKAGTYFTWLIKQNRTWLVVATDENGGVKGSTNSLTLHMDQEDKTEFFQKTLVASLTIPPYAERTKALTKTQQKQEAKLTRVHAPCVEVCRSVWTKIDDPNSSGRGTVCWQYEHCYCK